MPTAALHSHYWESKAAGAPPDPPQSAGVVSYPTAWHTTVTIGSVFGALQAVYENWRPSVTTTQQVRDDGDNR